MANITLSVPDTAIPRIRRAFGGSTNAETLANVRAYLLTQLRLHVLEVNMAQRREAEMANVDAALASETTGLDADWPVS